MRNQKPGIYDALGRPLQVLRLSVTDRCNLRCRYCMPAELFGPNFKFRPREEILTFEEISVLVNQFADMGVRKVKFTGGEPLLRSQFPKLVTMIHKENPELELSLTTNGTRLERLAGELREAGLNRINVSLDSFDPLVANQIAGMAVDPDAVWRAVLCAKRKGFEVKLNTVVIRGINEDEIIPLARECRNHGIQQRFIEYMDVGRSNEWKPGEVVTGKEIMDRLNEAWPIVAATADPTEKIARKFWYADGASGVGFINSISEPFCRGCDRARLSADGFLFTCLFSSTGIPVKDWIREERLSPEQIGVRLRGIWSRRTDRYSELRSLEEAPAQSTRSEMWAIGG